VLAQLGVGAAGRPEVQGALEERAGVAAPEQVERLGHALGPGRQGVGGGHELLGAADAQVLDGGGDERAAGLEVVQVRAARQPRPHRHRVGGRRRVAVFDQALDRGVEQRLAGGGAALRLAATNRSHL
jgi:hypothetical protein